MEAATNLAARHAASRIAGRASKHIYGLNRWLASNQRVAMRRNDGPSAGSAATRLMSRQANACDSGLTTKCSSTPARTT